MSSIHASREHASMTSSGPTSAVTRNGHGARRHANRRWLAPAVLAGVVLAAGAAEAQSSAPRDPALAETLFQDAKQRMTHGDYAGACPKLAESYRLDPGSGTLTALALCHEQLGQNATAWAEFIELVSEAQRGGRGDREKFARQHAAALEPGLSRLTITVAPETAALPDVQVQRDKVVVGAAAWDVASPIDPGDHVVEATAPDHQRWSVHVQVGPNGDRQVVSVPALAENPATASSAPAPSIGAAPAEAKEAANDAPESPPAHGGGAQRAAGIGIGAVGLVSVAFGSYFGVQALSKSHDAKQDCSPSSCADPNSVHENNVAKTDALVSDITLGAGIVAFGVGAYLLFSAPSASPAPSSADSTGQHRVRVIPLLGRRIGGVAFQTAW
jgi:hypothetical protein